MIEIKNASFNYIKGQGTLDDISINIKKGECILLCGESGCGKTTVTKLINGLIPHFEEQGELKGGVTVAGLDTSKAELYELSCHVGSVFQNPKSQFFHTDAESEIVFGLENSGVEPAVIKSALTILSGSSVSAQCWEEAFFPCPAERSRCWHLLRSMQWERIFSFLMNLRLILTRRLSAFLLSS